MHRSAVLPLLVEEEYLLLPVPPGRHSGGGGGRPLGLLPAVDGRVGGPSGPRQVASATPVCTTRGELRDALVRQRKCLADRAGPRAVLVPVGVVPGHAVHAPLRSEFDEEPAADPPGWARTRDLVNGMSVHVQLPDRETGVTVMNRLRPWLHVLLALGANSPIWQGRDTGFASWRAVMTRTWPASGPPPYLEDVAGYDRQVERFRSMGVIPSDQPVNWTLRLSDRLVGVEVRVADVQIDPDAAAMLAELARALVCRALRDATVGVLVPRPPAEIIQAACWHAARHGVRDYLVDLSPSTAGTPRPAPVADITTALLTHVEQTSAGMFSDLAVWVTNVLEGTGSGSGAQRQRRAWEERGLPGLLDLVAITGSVTSVS